VSLCPSEIGFVTNGNYTLLAAALPGYLGHASQMLANVMGVSLTRIQKLEVHASLQHEFFLEPASTGRYDTRPLAFDNHRDLTLHACSELDSTTAVARLIQTVNNGDLIIFYDNAYYTGLDVSCGSGGWACVIFFVNFVELAPLTGRCQGLYYRRQPARQHVQPAGKLRLPIRVRLRQW